MLARPEVGTKQHILLWLASKPADEVFDWCSLEQCACGQYARENLGWKSFPERFPWGSCDNLQALNKLAFENRTFGTLHEAVQLYWSYA